MMCIECYYCSDCTDQLCSECGEYCSDCVSVCAECGKCENCIDSCNECELCADCCREATEEFGCYHEICISSSEWESHYCTYGKHCVEGDTDYDSDESMHWNICGEGCNVKLNADYHLFGGGQITKEATENEEGIIVTSCVVCGYEKSESIPKLNVGHKHEYTDVVKAPTCTEQGYTTHTCSCGYTYVDNQTAAVNHYYQLKSSDDEHWNECTVCHEITSNAVHKFGGWTTVIKPGYTFTGIKQRECKHCGYILSEEIPMLKVPEDKVVITIKEYPVTEPDGSETITDPNGSTATPPNSDVGATPNNTSTKEILTKGDDNSIPTLPVLPPSEDGNYFDGWVDKATGEPVNKGDKITENIEIIPVWKDCGEGNHADADGDNACDECGYNLVKPTTPANPGISSESDTPPEIEDGEGKTDSTESPSGSIPMFVVIAMSLFGIAVIGCATVIVVISRRKTKNDK